MTVALKCETEKYSNAMAVMSSEGFGEQAKAVAETVLKKIAAFFVKIGEWFAKLGEAIGKVFLNAKFAASAGPKGKELIKLQGEISKQQSVIMKTIAKETAANANSESAGELAEIYKVLQNWAKRGMDFSKEVFTVCKAYARGISIISKLTDKSKLGAVETFAEKAFAITKKVSDSNFLYEATYKDAVAKKDVSDANRNIDAINDGIGQLNQLKNDITNVLNALEEEEKKLKAAPEPTPTKPAA